MTDMVASTPFADTCAADLRFATAHLPRRPRRLPKAIAVCPGPTFDGASTTLRVLGASHQMILQLPDSCWIETLAWNAKGKPAEFPSGSVQLVDDWAYACRLELLSYPDPAEFTAQAAELDDIDHSTRLGVRFAGDPDARTLIAASVHREAETEVLTWESWHLYPQHGEIVHSVSTAQALGTRGRSGTLPDPDPEGITSLRISRLGRLAR